MNEAHFAGHFPDNPVMPGVLMVEGLAQTAAVLVLRLMPPTDRPRNMYFMSIPPKGTSIATSLEGLPWSQINPSSDVATSLWSALIA
jgi:hypothetical protein